MRIAEFTYVEDEKGTIIYPDSMSKWGRTSVVDPTLPKSEWVVSGEYFGDLDENDLKSSSSNVIIRYKEQMLSGEFIELFTSDEWDLIESSTSSKIKQYVKIFDNITTVNVREGRVKKFIQELENEKIINSERSAEILKGQIL